MGTHGNKLCKSKLESLAALYPVAVHRAAAAPAGTVGARQQGVTDSLTLFVKAVRVVPMRKTLDATVNSGVLVF